VFVLSVVLVALALVVVVLLVFAEGATQLVVERLLAADRAAPTIFKSTTQPTVACSQSAANQQRNVRSSSRRDYCSASMSAAISAAYLWVIR
jgi:hypothetical protein